MDESRVIRHIDVNSVCLSWEAAYRVQHGATVELIIGKINKNLQISFSDIRQRNYKR